VPTAREVAPWVAAVGRLWDDAAFAESHRLRALGEAPRWAPDAVADRLLTFFGALTRR
jgi:hypothetical protein